MTYFESMGYVRHPYDTCLMTFPKQLASGVLRRGKQKDPKENHVNEGIILIEVDDLMVGGTAVHRQRMEAFCTSWKCGTRKISAKVMKMVI